MIFVNWHFFINLVCTEAVKIGVLRHKIKDLSRFILEKTLNSAPELPSA